MRGPWKKQIVKPLVAFQAYQWPKLITKEDENMPILPAKPRMYDSSATDFYDRKPLGPGVHVCVLTEWAGPKEVKGKLYYILRWEQCLPKGRGLESSLWIECDARGLPVLTAAGEGRYQMVLRTWGLLGGDEAVDTSKLLFRCAKVTIKPGKSKPFLVKVEACSEAEEELALEYVTAHFPLE